MAFVRTKKVRGKEYHQLVESRRVDGEPRQRVLVHLGQHATPDAALEEWPKEIRRLRRLATRQRGAAEELPDRDASRRAAQIDAKLVAEQAAKEPAQ